MLSKFKEEKPSHVFYKSGARHFEAEKSSNILSLPIVEAYDQQIRLMSASFINAAQAIEREISLSNNATLSQSELTSNVLH